MCEGFGNTSEEKKAQMSSKGCVMSPDRIVHLHIAEVCSTDSTGKTRKYWGFRVCYIFTYYSGTSHNPAGLYLGHSQVGEKKELFGSFLKG